MPDAIGLTPLDRMAVWHEASLIQEKHPKYRWGGDVSEEKGLDCSGFVYLVFKRAGFAVARTTSRNMRLGLSGWSGVEIADEPFQVGDLVFWTWSDRPQRPDGHVGIIMEVGRREKVAHSSASRGVVTDEFTGKFIDDMSALISPRIGK